MSGRFSREPQTAQTAKFSNLFIPLKCLPRVLHRDSVLSASQLGMYPKQ